MVQKKKYKIGKANKQTYNWNKILNYLYYKVSSEYG